jgi:hypothetical protein
MESGQRDMLARPRLAAANGRWRDPWVNRARMATAVLAGLAAIAGCSAPAVTATATVPATLPMPAEPHDLPTLLGPVNGSGSRAFIVTMRSPMAVELGCRGKGMARARSPFGDITVWCDNTPGAESFGGSYFSAHDLERDNLRPGQRVSLRIAVPAGDTWRLWVTGGPATA